MKNILIVEDNHYYHKLLQKTLERNGYETTSAYNGEEALKILEGNEQQFDLIILDIMMPVLCGEEFLKQYDKISIENKPYVCILTASLDDIILKDFDEELVIGFFSKTYNIKTLLFEIETIYLEKKPIKNMMSVYSVNELLTNFEVLKENQGSIVIKSNNDIATNSIIKLRKKKKTNLYTVESVSRKDGDTHIYARKISWKGCL